MPNVVNTLITPILDPRNVRIGYMAALGTIARHGTEGT